MKKFLLITSLIALICTATTVVATAQRGAGQGGVGRPRKQIIPFRKRPPIVDPQPGRNPNPNKARNRQLQRQQLMEAVGLTADQRTRMGEINRTHQDEAISIGRRVRQARNALDRAIMNPVVDEAQVKRHTEELASAQADQVRFQSRMRAQMRSVLTADQVRRLMQLEQERRREMREERRDQEIERIR